MSIKITVLSVLIAGLSLCGALADIVLQPGPGANDGTDDGSASSGKDASTWSGNGGAKAVLWLFNSPCNEGLRNSYLQFSTAGLPAQGVTKAEIQVYCKVYSQGDGWPWPVSPQFSVRRVTQPWNEMTVTPATAPAVDPLVVDTHTVSVVGGGGFYTEYEGWLSFDVTSLYLGWASGATNNYGIEFRIDNAFCQNGDIFAINSSDHTNALLRPKLVLKGVDLPPQVLTSDASFGVRTNRFGFTIIGFSNLVIVVEACTNPAQAAWSPVGTNTGDTSYFSDPQWTNYPARFYRLRSP